MFAVLHETQSETCCQNQNSCFCGRGHTKYIHVLGINMYLHDLVEKFGAVWCHQNNSKWHFHGIEISRQVSSSIKHFI